jgi:hypothetical protein
MAPPQAPDGADIDSGCEYVEAVDSSFYLQMGVGRGDKHHNR